jgi:lipoprotein-releasing system permease protein
VGIALGVATLIIVMAVMNGFRAELMGRVLGINAHVTVNSFYSDGFKNYEAERNSIMQMQGIRAVLPKIDGEVMVSANGMNSGALVRAMDAGDIAQKKIVASGVRGNLTDFKGRDVVMIGSRMADRMGVAVGDSIQLIAPKTTATILGAIPRLKSFKVVGMVDVGMFEYDNGTIYMPIEAAQIFFKKPQAVDGFEVYINEPAQSEAIADAISKTLNPRAFYVRDWQQMNSNFFDALKVERNVMFLILTLIIIVAAFNIISGLVMLVKDKTRDIAILRTMGASRGAIMRIFLMTGASIGVIGTLLGFAMGTAFALNIEAIRQFIQTLIGQELFSAEIYYLTRLPADVQAGDVIAVVTMSLVLSLLATIYPAWRAAKVDPAEGVRS